MADDKRTKQELIEENERLKNRIKELEVLEFEQKRQEEEFSLRDDDINLAWAGNLGRWEWDVPTGKVIYNKRKIETLGYKEGEIDPDVWGFTEMLHPDDYENTMQNMRDHLEMRKPAYETEYRIRTKDGNWKWYYDRGIVTKRDENGNPLKLAGIVFDIDEKKRAEIALKESKEKYKELNTRKDKFFSIIAHDLRNPFNVLLNASKELLEASDEISEEDRKELISMINESSRQTYNLLTNLLGWARSQLGKVDFNPEDLDLNEVANQITYTLKNFANSKGVIVKNEIDEKIQAYADRNMIATVLRNLVSNSIKFCGKDDNITIRAEKNHEKIIMSVNDSGMGMNESIKNKLFKIEEQSSRPGTKEEKGTGLGLILCKEFVEKNGGSIWVESEENKGTTFYFTLPMKKMN